VSVFEQRLLVTKKKFAQKRGKKEYKYVSFGGFDTMLSGIYYDRNKQ
jgi:hypothetical protein